MLMPLSSGAGVPAKHSSKSRSVPSSKLSSAGTHSYTCLHAPGGWYDTPFTPSAAPLGGASLACPCCIICPSMLKKPLIAPASVLPAAALHATQLRCPATLRHMLHTGRWLQTVLFIAEQAPLHAGFAAWLR